jgi:hypothetical protein
MTHSEQHEASRSRAIYGLLLEFYPRHYLKQHRAEMLQNFQDLERASQSKPALWLFIGRDLVVSLRAQFTKTLGGQTAIVVFVLSGLLLYAEHLTVARERVIERFCFGYVLGWFAGWFSKRWHASSAGPAPNGIRSFRTQVTITVGALVVVSAAWGVSSGLKDHVLWTLCYGFLLAWLAGWIGNRRPAQP